MTRYLVMTVCTGNICRSPMAEVVLRARFEGEGLDAVVAVDSAGISDEERGNPIDPRAADVLREAGYPVPRHSARRVRADELAARDLVLPMTARHARALRTLAPQPARVRMLRSFDPAAPAVMGPGAVADEAQLDIEDPWYGGRDDFVAVLGQIRAAAEGVLAHVRTELAGRASAG